MHPFPRTLGSECHKAGAQNSSRTTLVVWVPGARPPASQCWQAHGSSDSLGKSPSESPSFLGLPSSLWGFLASPCICPATGQSPPCLSSCHPHVTFMPPSFHLLLSVFMPSSCHLHGIPCHLHTISSLSVFILSSCHLHASLIPSLCHLHGIPCHLHSVFIPSLCHLHTIFMSSLCYPHVSASMLGKNINFYFLIPQLSTLIKEWESKIYSYDLKSHVSASCPFLQNFFLNKAKLF